MTAVMLNVARWLDNGMIENCMFQVPVEEIKKAVEAYRNSEACPVACRGDSPALSVASDWYRVQIDSLERQLSDERKLVETKDKEILGLRGSLIAGLPPRQDPEAPLKTKIAELELMLANVRASLGDVVDDSLDKLMESLERLHVCAEGRAKELQASTATIADLRRSCGSLAKRVNLERSLRFNAEESLKLANETIGDYRALADLDAKAVKPVVTS